MLALSCIINADLKIRFRQRRRSGSIRRDSILKRRGMGNIENLPVFVYGTLRPGQKNYPRYLRGRTRRERSATISGQLYFVEDGGYPYLTPGRGEVFGDLMELCPSRCEEVLREVDRLEDYDPLDEEHSVYLRRKTEADLGNGERVTAWVYYWNRPEVKGKRIFSGDFTRRN